jgi:hypothetical protein
MGLAHAVHAMMATFHQRERGPKGELVWNCSNPLGKYLDKFDDQRCMHSFFLRNRHAGGWQQ